MTRFSGRRSWCQSPVSTRVTRQGSATESVDLHAVLGEIEGHVRRVEEVVGEVLLDHVALVAKADDEVGDAVVRRRS